MENIRKKYICKIQIKKGITGVKEILSLFNKGYSLALMIDQRVSEGIRSNFFNKKALTTTIPAQFVKKFNSEVIPVHIERSSGVNFKIKIFSPIKYAEEDTIEQITDDLNLRIEKMIKINPSQWIWTHGRWK